MHHTIKKTSRFKKPDKEWSTVSISLPTGTYLSHTLSPLFINIKFLNKMYTLIYLQSYNCNEFYISIISQEAPLGDFHFFYMITIWNHFILKFECSWFYVLAILKNFTVGYQNFKYFCKIKNLQYFSVFIKCTGNDVFIHYRGVYCS